MLNHADLEKLADAVVAVIREKPNQSFSFSWLADELKTDSDAIQQAVHHATGWGYGLEIRRNERVQFISPPDSLFATEIQYDLRTKWLGKTVLSYRAVKSTNDLAAEMANAGAAEGTVITAEQQIEGRGRLGRTWFSPFGSGVYVSVIFRPAFEPESAPGMSVMTALALLDAIVACSPGEARLKQISLKWPNDLLIGGRKVAGILTELATEDRVISHVVIGIGINVNASPNEFPEEIADTATSIYREIGRKINRVELLRAFLRNLEKQYSTYLVHGLKKDHDKIRKYSSLIGHEVTLQAGRVRMQGLVKDIDADGRLMLQTDDGLQPIIAGEVTVVKE
ncbi:biotin--[acetyl-CoA-carboxylase] ligase [candidate division GN15 bacterium]|nr:biotin--[acetyl-CoA-carboxylase] ligase [candidate division GN15 bacterium]